MNSWKTMRQEEIAALCARNEAISKAWRELSKRTGFSAIKRKVVEIYSSAHFVLPIDEVSIIFKVNNHLDKYVIEMRDGTTKFTLYQNVA